MKKILAALTAAAFLAAWTTSLMAAEQTIKGDAICTKCDLHQTAQCGTAIRTTEGKVYYAADNDVAKAFHKNICQTSAKVVATGTVTEKDGKKTITLSKIEVAAK
jgi:hypothetical protein